MRDHYRRLSRAGDVLLTLNLVLAETATRLRYDAGLRTALDFRDALEAATATERVVIRHADEDLDRKAWEVMEKYADQSLSFTDCAGAVAAKEGGASAVFGLDSDFIALGFALEP